jgi:hypothetical protein
MKTSIEVFEDRIQAISKERDFDQNCSRSGVADAMSLSLTTIQRSRRAPHTLTRPKGGSIKDAVLYFRATGTFRSYREGRYVCVGASLEESGWCLLGDPRLLAQLLSWCKLTVTHQSLRFYFCLLQSIRSFPELGEGMPADWKTGWNVLRDWLEEYQSSHALTMGLRANGRFILNQNANKPIGQTFQRKAQGLRAAHVAGSHSDPQPFEGASVSFHRIEASPAQLTRWQRASKESPFCFPSLVELANSGPDSANTCSAHADCLKAFPLNVGMPSARSEPTISQNKAVPILGRAIQDRTAWSAPIWGNGVLHDERFWVKVRPGVQPQPSNGILESLSEHVRGNNQQLDFLFGFAPVIRSISVQLKTQG